jgi:hypothetical protein
MNRTLTRLTVAWLSLVLAGNAVAGARELERLALDDAAAIGLAIHTDAATKAEGKASVRIETAWPTTVCLGEVTGLDVENAQLLYRARVRTRLEGEAYLEMWVHLGGGQYFSRGLNDTVAGQTDWKTIQTLFNFEKGQKPEKVTLNLVINGRGTVWVDDVVLSR